MLNPASPLARLMDAPMRPGRVEWIGIRPARRVAVVSVPAALLDPVDGVVGDRYRSATTGKRQVTLIGALDLVAIAQVLGLAAVAPELVRRNVVVSGINLHALQGRRFMLGGAMLEATGGLPPVLAHGGGVWPGRLQRNARVWRDHGAGGGAG